jgi:hypothetical protein
MPHFDGELVEGSEHSSRVGANRNNMIPATFPNWTRNARCFVVDVWQEHVGTFTKKIDDTRVPRWFLERLACLFIVVSLQGLMSSLIAVS